MGNQADGDPWGCGAVKGFGRSCDHGGSELPESISRDSRGHTHASLTPASKIVALDFLFWGPSDLGLISETVLI